MILTSKTDPPSARTSRVSPSVIEATVTFSAPGGIAEEGSPEGPAAGAE